MSSFAAVAVDQMFTNLDQFVAYPRLGRAIAGGGRLIFMAGVLDNTGGKYKNQLWELSPRTHGKTMQITDGLPVSCPVLAPDGTLYFLRAASEGQPLALWQQKPGQDPQIIAEHPGGFLQVKVGETAIVATANMLAASQGNLEKEQQLRQRRKEQNINAHLQTSLPISQWDHDTTSETHIYRVVEHSRGGAQIVDLLPQVGQHLREATWNLSSDGCRIAMTWCFTSKNGIPRSSLAVLDVHSRGFKVLLHASDGEHTPADKVDLDPETAAYFEAHPSEKTRAYDWMEPVLSPSGRRVLLTKHVHGDQSRPDDRQLWIVNCEELTLRLLSTPDFDRWPVEKLWLPDRSIIVSAFDHGNLSVYRFTDRTITKLTDNGNWASLALVDFSKYRDFTASELRELYQEDLGSTPDILGGANTPNPLAAGSGQVAPGVANKPHTYSPKYALLSLWSAPDAPPQLRLLLGVEAGHDDALAQVALPAVLPQPALPGRVEVLEVPLADGSAMRVQLLLPHTASTTAPAPLLLWVHGGPMGTWSGWSWRWNPWIFVARGYAVLMPDPALSVGYGLDYIARGWGKWGDVTYQDVMQATDFAAARTYIDSNKISAMGGSFGGYMMNWIAGHTDRFRCILSHASLWNIPQFLTTTDHPAYWRRELTPETVAKYSPHLFAQQINTPMLVIHGQADRRVPFDQSKSLYWQLLHESKLASDENGISPHRFLIFPTDHHWVVSPGNSKVWYQSALAFLAENGMAPNPEAAAIDYPETLA